MEQYQRFYKIAGLTIHVNSDIPITDQTFSTRFTRFLVNEPHGNTLDIWHHFQRFEVKEKNNGKLVFKKNSFEIYRYSRSWIYINDPVEDDKTTLPRLAVFNSDHTIVHIYNPSNTFFLRGNIPSLSLLASDQIMLSRVLADRMGCFFHAAGMILQSDGYLFVGHSGAGKSTMVTILQDEGEILCDDRMIVRRWTEGFKIHGTWSHGDVPVVSPNSAPLQAILLLEQAPHNRLIPITDHREIVRTLPFFVIRPLVTADWWEKTLDLVGAIAREVPVYLLQFDKSGGVRQELKELK